MLAPPPTVMTLPEVIIVGNVTRYRHFARGTRDFYAPELFLPDPPPQHVWCYCISKEHGNTVYFFNESSGRSLWVLPSLTADGEEIGDNEDEVMQVIGSVESAALKNKRSPLFVNDKGQSEEKAESRRIVLRQSLEKAVRRQAEEMEKKHNGKPQLQQHEQKQEQEQGDVAQMMESSLPVYVAKNGSKNNDGNVSVSHRLALWRAKRAEQQQGMQQQKEEDHGDEKHPFFDVTPGLLARGVDEAISSSSCHGYCPMAVTQPELLNNASSCALHNSDKTNCDKIRKASFTIADENTVIAPKAEQECLLPERKLYDEKRRLFLEAKNELQREKEEALQKERQALERARRLQEAQQLEEEERTRLAIERRQLEQRRLELEKLAIARQRAILAKAEGEEVARRELNAQLDDFLRNKLRLVQQAEEEARHMLSLEEAIAESLLGCVTAKSANPSSSEVRCVDLRILEDDDMDNSRNADSPGARQQQEEQQQQAKKQKERRREQIRYAPSLTYVGDVMTGGRGEAPALLRRHGRGTCFYDAAQKFFYDGQWEDDKRNGSGVISLPHVVVEGGWRNDKLDGCAMFQTKRIKGTTEFKKGVLDGNAVVELDCNSVFAGRLLKNAVGAKCGAMTFSSGDRVEWISDLTENGQRGTSPSEQKFRAGSGTCRVNFANGDVYLGQAKNYQPHGKGSYRFTAEGHEYIGEFQHGLLQEHGTYRFANGDVYVGQLYKGLFHGKGKYVQGDAYVYEGSWEYGTAHGSGKLSFANGDVWEGEFDHDRRVKGRYTASRLFQLQ